MRRGYTYDPVGNRLSRISTLSAVLSSTSAYDANDRLTSDSYDANGNTRAAGGHTYAYDFQDRIKSADGGAVKIVYDGDGNRVSKTVGGVTTRYLVDERNPTGYAQVVEELVGGAGLPSCEGRPAWHVKESGTYEDGCAGAAFRRGRQTRLS